MKRRFHTNVDLLAEPFDDTHIVNVKWVRDNIGELVPSALSFEFEFPDPLATGDFVEVTVTADCTIPADLDDSEYVGTPETDDMHFELTEEPSSVSLGEIEVAAGNVLTWSGVGGEVTAGTTLRMTATDIVGGSVSPGAVIKVAATRKAAPPPTAGRFEFPQSVASTTWTITHGLGQRIVAVQVVADNGATVWGDWEFDTVNRCILHFSQAVSGIAVIRR